MLYDEPGVLRAPSLPACRPTSSIIHHRYDDCEWAVTPLLPGSVLTQESMKCVWYTSMPHFDEVLPPACNQTRRRPRCSGIADCNRGRARHLDDVQEDIGHYPSGILFALSLPSQRGPVVYVVYLLVRPHRSTRAPSGLPM